MISHNLDHMRSCVHQKNSTFRRPRVTYFDRIIPLEINSLFQSCTFLAPSILMRTLLLYSMYIITIIVPWEDEITSCSAFAYVHVVMDIFILDSYVVILFSDKWTSWGLFVGTQITPQGWIFWTIIFYHQKIQVKSYLMRGQT